jgi:hypothetical protein
MLRAQIYLGYRSSGHEIWSRERNERERERKRNIKRERERERAMYSVLP